MLEVCGRKQNDGHRRGGIVRPVLAHKSIGAISLFRKFCKKFLSGKADKNSGRNRSRFHVSEWIVNSHRILDVRTNPCTERWSLGRRDTSDWRTADDQCSAGIHQMSTHATCTELDYTIEPWRDFAPGPWMKRIDVRDFIIANVTPYEGDGAFLSGPTERTKAVWAALQPYFREEAHKGVLDVDAATPSTMTSHAPGYIDQYNEVIVGLQTDKPFKRAIMPWGGLRMVENGLHSVGMKVDPKVAEIFTQYRKTHNDGVFDVYTPEILACRKSHIITGLPDAYGRGRIIGDYRRVALYGVARLLDEKAVERAQIDDEWPTNDVIRLREELAEQTRARHLQAIKH